MVKISIDKTTNIEIPNQNIDGVIKYIQDVTSMVPGDFYLEQNGRRLYDYIDCSSTVYLRLCILGGKGGFGSMLRAIGAQIEKTTNREACRDLSGRRLRDINEEKRLKSWLDKQGERELESEKRKKRKIEKLLAMPKHEFKDEDYEAARSRLTEKVCDAVEEGFKKTYSSTGNDLKRKHGSILPAVKAKKKKAALWIDDLSDDTNSSEDDDYVSEPIFKGNIELSVDDYNENINLTPDKESDD